MGRTLKMMKFDFGFHCKQKQHPELKLLSNFLHVFAGKKNSGMPSMVSHMLACSLGFKVLDIRAGRAIYPTFGERDPSFEINVVGGMLSSLP